VSEIACVNCLYWQPLPQIQNAGRCRVCPPAIGSAINNLNGAIWPVSMNDDWCGSFCFSELSDRSDTPEPFTAPAQQEEAS
jgi:hypothetical protein